MAGILYLNGGISPDESRPNLYVWRDSVPAQLETVSHQISVWCLEIMKFLN